jgi:HD-like signal output (HDOD) protein
MTMTTTTTTPSAPVDAGHPPATQHAGFVADVLSGRVSVPMVPRVIMRVIEELRGDGASLARIAADIEQDPILNSRVLRLANSSYFGGRRSVSAVSDAVGMIGFAPLETLLIACGAQAAFADVPAVNLRQFWLSSVVTASAARTLADELHLDRDAAYTAGLLLGVGHLILCKFHPKEAVAEFTTIRHSWGVALADREMKAFGATHGHISSLWADKLGLPTTIVQAHIESMMPIGLHSTPLAGVVQLAATMAGAVAARQSVQQVRTALAGPVADSLGLAAHLASGEFEDAYGELHSLTGLQ